MQEGGSALLCAAQNGYTEVVEILLKSGASVDSQLSDGANGVFLAAQNGHLETMRTLLRYGCPLIPRNVCLSKVFYNKSPFKSLQR